jgi:hypothetical protein
VSYILDAQFGTADYEAYTAMMFEVPVAEWHQKYRRLDYEPLPENDLSFGGTVVSANNSYPANYFITDKDEEFVNPLRISKSTTVTPSTDKMGSDPAYHDVPVHSAEMLAENGLNWYKDRLGYKSLPYLWGGGVGVNAINKPSYFPFATAAGSKWGFKVTSVNDPDAADIGEIVPSGQTRIFLMPHVGLWAGVATSFDMLTRYILGPVWQITPRVSWPRYGDREYGQTTATFTMPTPAGPTTTATGYVDDLDGIASAFLEYQASRAGMQASLWTLAAPNDSRLTAIVSAAAPGDFPTANYSFFSQMIFNSSGGAAFNGSAGNHLRGDSIFTMVPSR